MKYRKNKHKSKMWVSSKIYFSQKKNSALRGHEFTNYTLQEFREWLYKQKKFHVIFDKWVRNGYQKKHVPSCHRLDHSGAYNLN